MYINIYICVYAYSSCSPKMPVENVFEIDN